MDEDEHQIGTQCEVVVVEVDHGHVGTLAGFERGEVVALPDTRPASIVIHVEDLLRRHDARVAVVVRTIVSLARLPRRRHNVRAAVRRHRDSTTLSLAMFTTGDDANPPTANRIACLLVGILIPLLLITGGLPALKDLVVLVGLSIAIVVGLCVVGLAMEFEQRYPILLTERYERHGERKARKG